MRSVLSRLQVIALVAVLWAAIYLPGLGSLPIKGEEGRRILPAVTMIQSGNYLVPEVGGAAYFSKPPLINWLIAASFNFFHVRNEWTARLPSAVSVLVVAIALVTVARAPLSPSGSLFAALMWLTSAGIIEKGRLAEIEALYVSLTALAIVCWLSFWKTNRSPWLIWIPASIFLGLALLTKGPVHLIFFYATAIAVAWQSKNWRVLFHPAHFLGILIMIGIFAAWAVPFVDATNSATAATKWGSQFSGRLAGRDFHFASWIFNIPRGLCYFLPWTIFLLIVRPSRFAEPRDQQLGRALIWGAAVPFVIVNLVPGALPRYSMPALVPAGWLLAMAFAQSALEWSRWLNRKTCRRIVTSVTLVIAVGVIIDALVVIPRLKPRQNIRESAAQIDRAISPNESLYALDPNYQPIFFYVRAKIAYIDELSGVPPSATYLATRPDREPEVLSSEQWMPRHAHPLFQVTDYRQQSLILFKIE